MFHFKYKSEKGKEVEVKFNGGLWITVIKAVMFITPFVS